jgi:hypothetical protein
MDMQRRTGVQVDRDGSEGDGMTTAAKPSTLAQAFVAFQAEAPHIKLDGKNPHFNSKFATLAGIMDAVRPVLAKARPRRRAASVLRRHRREPAPRTPHRPSSHASGEREEDVMLLAIDRPGPQAQGSALTYARRYAVLAILGLVGDEDDDAEGAEKEAAKFEAPKGVNGGTITPEQKKHLETLTKTLLDGGHITKDQLESASKGAKPAELLARLERYASDGRRGLTAAATSVSLPDQGERVTLPSGHSLFYFDDTHSYWRINDQGSRGRRLTGVTTVCKTLDHDPSRLLKWAAETQCIGVVELAKAYGDRTDWLCSQEVLLEELRRHALTFEDVKDQGGEARDECAPGRVRGACHRTGAARLSGA